MPDVCDWLDSLFMPEYKVLLLHCGHQHVPCAIGMLLFMLESKIPLLTISATARSLWNQQSAFSSLLCQRSKTLLGWHLLANLACSMFSQRLSEGFAQDALAEETTE